MADINIKDPSTVAGTTLDSQRFADLGVRNRVFEDGRIPFVLTCLSWQARGRYLYFWVNPSSIDLNFKLRGTTQVTKGGTISYQWRASNSDRGGLGFYDEPRIGITFQTGNCMPVRMTSDGDVVRVPPGLLDLYDFMELMNEPLVLDNGSMNYRLLFYNSAIFPNIIFYGWMPPEEGFTIHDGAEDPNQTSWTTNFIVRKTSPDFKSAQAMAYAFKAFSLGSSQLPRVQTNVGDPNAPVGVGQTQDQLEGTDQARLANLLPTPEQSDRTINLNLGLNGVGNQNTKNASK